MKILIATGIYPPDIGGPAYYAKSLYGEFSKAGYRVKVLSYKIEKKLPIGLRHFVFFVKILFALRDVDFVVALDTFSVGFPSVLACKLAKKKIIIRTGGDFLWEAYIARTKDKVLLSDFYKGKRNLSLKEKIIFRLTKMLLNDASAVVFSTDWQRKIFLDAYNLDNNKTFIIENYYGSKEKPIYSKEKIFLWAGRNIPLKNVDTLKKAFKEAQKTEGGISLDISGTLPHSKLIEKIKTCYAVVLPSISEVSSNFLLEAVMFGKPFITTKDNGLYERLKDVGIFINPFDVEELKKAILFLSDDINYKNITKKLSRFDFTHSYKEIAQEFIEVYKKI